MSMPWATATARVGLLLALALPAPARALRPGDLDPTFGVGGRVVTPIATPGSEAWALALQSDGALLAAGGSWSTSILLRYLPSGEPDPAFGSAGVIEEPGSRHTVLG